MEIPVLRARGYTRPVLSAVRHLARRSGYIQLAE